MTIISNLIKRLVQISKDLIYIGLLLFAFVFVYQFGVNHTLDGIANTCANYNGFYDRQGYYYECKIRTREAI